MKTQAASSAAAPAPLKPISYPAFLEKFLEKDRKSLARHMEAYEQKGGAEAARRWRRLACVLMTLAPHAPKILAAQAMQFFIPDGKYRKQVFALEAGQNGGLVVYVDDVLSQAVRAGIIAKARPDAEGQMTCPISGTDESLSITLLDGRTPNPAVIYKAMTAWNRKAVAITLAPDASSVPFTAVEGICQIAARQWADASEA